MPTFPYANPAHLASLRAGMDARVGGQDEAQARPGAEACLNQAAATLGRASAPRVLPMAASKPTPRRLRNLPG